MNLLDAKNIVAQRLGYKDWDKLLQSKIMDETEADAIDYMEIVSHHYAKAKLEEAAMIPGVTKTAAIAIMKIPVE